MPKFTTPNFIAKQLLDLENIDHYHLMEGYGILAPAPYEITYSGYYAKFSMPDEDVYLTLIQYIGQDNWWRRWQPDKSVLGSLTKTWKIKKAHKFIF